MPGSALDSQLSLIGRREVRTRFSDTGSGPRLTRSIGTSGRPRHFGCTTAPRRRSPLARKGSTSPSEGGLQSSRSRSPPRASNSSQLAAAQPRLAEAEALAPRAEAAGHVHSISTRISDLDQRGLPMPTRSVASWEELGQFLSRVLAARRSQLMPSANSSRVREPNGHGAFRPQLGTTVQFTTREWVRRCTSRLGNRPDRTKPGFAGPALVIVEARRTELIGQVGFRDRVAVTWSSSTESRLATAAAGMPRGQLGSSPAGCWPMAWRARLSSVSAGAMSRASGSRRQPASCLRARSSCTSRRRGDRLASAVAVRV